MRADARLLLPRPHLSGLIACLIVRDTRGRKLPPQERYSHFPVSPLCGVAWTPVGVTHLVGADGAIDPAPLPSSAFFGPRSSPHAGFAEGPMLGAMLILFPEAWRLLSGREGSAFRDRVAALEEAMAPELAAAFERLGWEDDCEAAFARLQDALTPLWRESRGPAGSRPWLGDWMRRLGRQAAEVGARQFQRRVKGWTGRTQRSLEAYARAEALFARTAREPRLGLAEMAAATGYADQSHMGREVKRVTGFPPAQILELAESDERFWFYRLMSEHYAGR